MPNFIDPIAGIATVGQTDCAGAGAGAGAMEAVDIPFPVADLAREIMPSELPTNITKVSIKIRIYSSI